MKTCALSFLLFFFSLAAMGAARAAVNIRPSDPPDMSVTVEAGEATLPSGQPTKIAQTTLTFDVPEIRDEKTTVKAPLDFVDWFAPWDPWPGRSYPANGPAAITLVPHADEAGTLILGGLFRAVIADSIIIKSADGSKTFKMGEDYKYNPDWAQIAGLGGHLGQPDVAPLDVTYKHALQRLDLVQVDANGKLSVKKGQSVMVCPALPQPDAGAAALAGIYIASWRAADNPHFTPPAKANAKGDYAITQHEIFPIHPAPPVAPINKQAVAGTLAKLKAGGAVKIAIVGASVEVGAEAGPWWDDKIKFTDKDLAWRGRFIVALRARFAQATITPIEATQGGTQTKYGLKVLDDKVLPAKPDLVVIDFGGNDVAGPVGGKPNNPPEQFKQDLLAMVQKAKAAGIEVILVVGAQGNPWLKNGQFQRWPEYRKAILEIGDQEKIGVADIYSEWDNLATRGIPPFSQLHNWINHPGPFGHGVWAETIERFFE